VSPLSDESGKRVINGAIVRVMIDKLKTVGIRIVIECVHGVLLVVH